jgi:hypothetical protein
VAVIRVVLAVVVATALFGVSLPVAERVERDRNGELATDELSSLAREADSLADGNAALEAGREPAGTTVVVDPPDPTLTDGGRLVVANDRLVWVPRTGRNRTVENAVPIRVETPLVLTGRTPLRLSLVSTGGAAVVRVRRARVQKRSRAQTPRVRGTPVDRRRLSV